MLGLSDNNYYHFMKKTIPGLNQDEKIQILRDAEEFNNHYINLYGFLNELFRACLRNDKIASAELCQKPLIFADTYSALQNYDLMQDYFYRKHDLHNCEIACLKALKELPFVYLQSLLKNNPIGYLGVIKRLCMIYKDAKEYDKVASLAKLGIKLDLKDGTKGGFEARLKQALKSSNNSYYDFSKEIGYDLNNIDQYIQKNFNYKTSKGV